MQHIKVEKHNVVKGYVRCSECFDKGTYVGTESDVDLGISEFKKYHKHEKTKKEKIKWVQENVGSIFYSDRFGPNYYLLTTNGEIKYIFSCIGKPFIMTSPKDPVGLYDWAFGDYYTNKKDIVRVSFKDALNNLIRLGELK